MHKKILILEDQKNLRRLICSSLKAIDATLLETSDVATALAAIQSEQPDVIILDRMLARGEDGLAVCRTVKNDPTLAKIQVIVLSARTQDTDQRAGRAAGADHYLSKPFSPKQLCELVTTLIQ
jgi:two-component system, OmpR family, alkaline phosphatase synthesis response regulator PhoP